MPESAHHPESELASAIVLEWTHLLCQSMHKIEHVIGQLNDHQIWLRPQSELNSIANLILHLAGNLRQWINSISESPSEPRDREAEFSARGGISANELLRLLKDTVESSKARLAQLNSDQLRLAMRVQGFEVTGLQAISHSVTHFVGHTHQIIMLARWILGPHYRFDWTEVSDRSSVPI